MTAASAVRSSGQRVGYLAGSCSPLASRRRTSAALAGTKGGAARTASLHRAGAHRNRTRRRRARVALQGSGRSRRQHGTACALLGPRLRQHVRPPPYYLLIEAFAGSRRAALSSMTCKLAPIPSESTCGGVVKAHPVYIGAARTFLRATAQAALQPDRCSDPPTDARRRADRGDGPPRRTIRYYRYRPSAIFAASAAPSSSNRPPA